jgi:APA family basic amino acid/polyamine antiporter
MVNVGVIVGSSIFLTARDVARAIPDAGLDLAMWGIAALFSLAGALTIAELGASLPRAGGLYVYLREAFGAFWGFMYGWALLVVIQTAAIAAISVAFATYVGELAALSDLGVQVLASGVVVALTVLNALGVRAGVVAQNVVTVAKIGAIVLLVALAFAFGGGAASAAAAGSAPVELGLGVIGAALIGPLFAFDGWITASYVAGEVRDPARTLPLAALASVVLVAAMYLALNGAYLHVLGVDGVAASRLPAADTARAVLGPRGADLAAVMVAIATLGSVNGCILGGARVTYALAHEGLFWRAAAHIDPRWGTPAIALAVQGAVSIAFVWSGRFDQLLTSCLFASWLFYALGGIAVFVLRRRKDLPRPYRVWGYPITPALFVGFAIVLLAATIAADPRDTAIGAALLLTGVPAYALFRRSAR